MPGWWDGLTGPLQVFYAIGSAAAAALALQLLLLAVGFGGDFDFGGDDAGLSGMISLLGLTAFFFVFGWVGVLLVAASSGRPTSRARPDAEQGRPPTLGRKPAARGCRYSSSRLSSSCSSPYFRLPRTPMMPAIPK